jgi:predicted metal-binding protein
MLSEYTSALLIHKKGRWSDFRDTMAELERFAFLNGYYKAFSFHSGPCNLCEECNIDGPCRNPSKARPSMEACGMDVFGTARAAGLPIQVAKTRADETNYYGLLLLE